EQLFHRGSDRRISLSNNTYRLVSSLEDAQNYFFPNDDGVNQFVQCITYLQCFTSQQHVCWRPVNQRYKVRDLNLRPEFTKEPTSDIVKKGSRVKLKCSFQPKEGDVRWWFDGTLLTAQRLEQLQMSINNGHLMIESFKDEEDISHVGYYQCEVTTEVGTILSKLAYLQLPDIREFKQRLTLEVRAPQGGEAVIPCEAPESRPAALVTYLKNGVPLSSSSDHHLVLPSGHLHIIDINYEDSGNYSCRAENPVSRVMVSSPTAIPLKVETDIFQSNIQPIIVYTSGDSVQRGQTAMLECGCMGKPLPQVRWSRVDGEFPEHTSRHGSTLLIHDVAVKNAGIYRCTADNESEEGPSHEEVTLEVSKTPSIKKPPKDADVIPGETATFRCIVGRASNDDVRWFFNGHPLTQDVDKYAISDGELVVRSVTMSDLGMYQCFVQTPEGNVQAAARMKLSDGFPKIIGEPQATTAIEGELVTMLCEIHGSPLPTVGWTDGQGTQVISSERMKVTEEYKEDVFIARLMIVNVGQEDIGNYTCKARNRLGMARATASFDDDRDYVRTPIIGSDIREYIITKLEAEVSYDIKMTTFTKHRESDFSNVVIQSTLARVTEPPPIIIPKPITEDPFAVQPTASSGSGAKENVLYIILGVVLGGMMLLMTMFIVMCFWRSKHMRGEVTMMRYVPPDLQHTMYNNAQYPYEKTHNGSLPHFNEPNGVPGFKNRKSQSANQLMWTETRPLYTMPQDTLSNGGAVLPYKTVPSTVMHLYSPLTPCSEVEVAEPPPIAEKQPSPPNLSPTANGSIPSLCSMSHNSLGPRPVCRIKRCRIPDEEEMRISPLLVPSHGRPSCSGDDSETGSISLKLNMEGYIKPSSGLSIPSAHEDDRTSNCSRPRSSSNQSNASSHQSNHHSDSSNGSSHQSFPVSVHSNSSVVTDV
ncbi:putative brother of CDO, partial [Apostichopus japonicus]